MAGPYVFSASQIDTFAGCPRKWAWNHIAGIKPPQADSAKIGDAAHKQLETYLEGGDLDFTQVVGGVRVADIAASGTHLLPAPRTTGVRIETSFRFTSPSTGYVYVGRKDLEVADGSLFPSVEGQPDVPAGARVVGDHKTSGNLSYAKTPEDLTWDIQANLYAYEALRTGANAVDLVWTYYQTKGAKKSKRVHLRVHRDHAERAFRGIERIATQMAAAHDAAANTILPKDAFVRTLPAVPAQCGKYGGCPYQANCQLTITERFQAQMSNGNDFFASLEQMAAAEDNSASALGASAGETDGSKGQETSKPSPAFTSSNTPGVETAKELTQLDNPINPPEASSSAPLPVPPDFADPPPASAEEAGQMAAAEAEFNKRVAEKKGGRGRPKGSKNKTVRGRTDEEDAADFIPDVKDRNAQPSVVHNHHTTVVYSGPTDAPKEERSYTLYIDCIPDGVDLTYADDLISQANERIKKASEEPVAHYSFLPYGKGRGALAVALEQLLSEQMHEDIFVSSTSDALPVLTVHAGRRIRAVR